MAGILVGIKEDIAENESDSRAMVKVTDIIRHIDMPIIRVMFIAHGT